MKRRVLSAALALTVLTALALPASAAAITHGTADQWIQEDALYDTPPEDYTIDQSVQGNPRDGDYNAYFLDTELQTVCIEIDETNLNYLLQHADQEPYVMTTSVTIGDTTLGYCGLRTKGNYTLSHSYTDNPGSDRFSFTVNFGKYITKELYGEKQNFYGCKKISFNNFFFDKSMMKEYFSLKLMEEMGLPTPQYGLAKLYINGEYYGVYFMVEAMDKSILAQYYDVDRKELSSYLCKPTGTSFDYADLLEDDSPLWEWDEDTYSEVEDMLPVVMDWAQKLNLLSQGQDLNGDPIDVQSQEYIDQLSTILNLDEVIRYFAVASWLCQMDNMFTNYQNFGLYVSEDGIATLIPWDYDLAFGCYYPSSAELTANYPLDVMYQLDRNRYAQEAETSQRYYANYPLFNAIYQNDDLMELYHSYMLDCSRIAALGGTVDVTGKSYDPGYFNSFIEAFQEALIAAASEELADNVYYMNHIQQPEGVEEALPNLSKIIAMRSVGVWAQVTGEDTTVCGGYCDLETLGNAITGESSNSGRLTIVDSATGIFATAEYSGSRRAFSPALYVTALTEEDDTYQQILSGLDVAKKDTLLVWSANTVVSPTSEYTLTVPLAQEYLGEDTVCQFYTWCGGELTALDMTRDGNLFTGTAKDISCVVAWVQPPQDDTPMILAIACGGALILTAVGILLLRHRKGARSNKRSDG